MLSERGEKLLIAGSVLALIVAIVAVVLAVTAKNDNDDRQRRDQVRGRDRGRRASRAR